MSRAVAAFLTLTVLQFPAAPVAAQIGLASGPQSVHLLATKRGSLGIAWPAGTQAANPGRRPLAGATAVATVPVVTSWNVDPARSAALTLVASFDPPPRARTANAVAIHPASAKDLGPAGGPKSFPPLARSGVGGGVRSLGAPNGTLVLFTQQASAGNAVGTRTDELQVPVDPSGGPDLLPGTYTGTLTLVATTQ